MMTEEDGDKRHLYIMPREFPRGISPDGYLDGCWGRHLLEVLLLLAMLVVLVGPKMTALLLLLREVCTKH